MERTQTKWPRVHAWGASFYVCDFLKRVALTDALARVQIASGRTPLCPKRAWGTINADGMPSSRCPYILSSTGPPVIVISYCLAASCHTIRHYWTRPTVTMLLSDACAPVSDMPASHGS